MSKARSIFMEYSLFLRVMETKRPLEINLFNVTNLLQ